ncbi:MAG: helix-turn-helix transcriptional regulator [Lachnospiraceae bacterium]|nr:helix-turn-helix transcriptional regulator [Lachnospiraceae bacterium]
MRRLFLTHYNTTPKQYIFDARIRMAQQFLTQTQLSVSSIAEECGFSNSYNLCRTFKSKVGLNPSEYSGSRRYNPK